MRAVFLIVALVALVAPAAADACSLVAVSDRERVKSADIAVYGEVVARELIKAEKPPLPGAEYRYRFRVIKAYKGRVGRTIEFTAGTNEAMCEAGDMSVGDRFGVLLHGRAPWEVTLGSFMSRAGLERATRPKKKRRRRG